MAAIVDIERISLSLVDLEQELLRTKHPDFWRAEELFQITQEMLTLATWVRDLGFIASNMETARDRKLARMVLQAAATLALNNQPLVLTRTNTVLMRSNNPAVVAEGRALRDEVERLASILQPCRIAAS